MNTDGLQAKLAVFAQRLHDQKLAAYLRQYPGSPLAEGESKVTVTTGSKYTRVDIGSSGRYMVENATGNIYGIKGYGVIHRGHYYGTLDEINAWDWSGYTAARIGSRTMIRKVGDHVEVSRF